MKSTGTKPPGELRSYFILERLLNTYMSEVDTDTNPQNFVCSQHAFEKQELFSVPQEATSFSSTDPVFFESCYRIKKSMKDNQQTASADGDDLTRFKTVHVCRRKHCS